MKTINFSNYFLVVLVCLPIFFLNVKSSLDWGDDFAQYIHQAKNITEGKPQSVTGYIYNEEYPEYAPPSYPPGYPLLLAVLYSFFGFGVHLSILFNCFFLLLFAMAIFHFLRKHFSGLTAIMLIIIFIYNPWTLTFKNEVLSDVSFSFFFLLSFLLYKREKYSVLNIILTGFTAGFMVSMRNIGILFVIANGFEILYDIIQSRKVSTLWKVKKTSYKLQVALLSILIFFLINKIIFPSLYNGFFSYSYIFDLHELKKLVLYNLSYYTGVMRAFFEPWNDHWQFVAIISGTMIFAFIILGMIKKFTSGFSFMDLLVTLYLFGIIIYPYSNAGFRFLFPLVPFILYYLITGILSVNIKIKIRSSFLAILMTIFVLVSYKKADSEIYNKSKLINPGPQEIVNGEMFSFIINNTPLNSKFYFTKPRALALYTNRKAMTHRQNRTSDEILKTLKNNNINYILINSEVPDDSLIAFVNTHEKECILIWLNEKNKVYKFSN